MKIITISLSVLPIKFGLYLLVKSNAVPKTNESDAHKLRSSPVWLVVVEFKQWKLKIDNTNNWPTIMNIFRFLALIGSILFSPKVQDCQFSFVRI